MLKICSSEFFAGGDTVSGKRVGVDGRVPVASNCGFAPRLTCVPFVMGRNGSYVGKTTGAFVEVAQDVSSAVEKIK